MKKIYYLSVYSVDDFENEKRYYPLSSAVKIDSIIKELLENNLDVEIVSASLSHGVHYCKRHRKNISDHLVLNLFSSLGRKNRFIKILDLIWLNCQLFNFFIRNIKSDDIVIVYHSLLYLPLVRILKKIIKFKLILEFEEMYSDVLNVQRSRKNEISLLHVADRYIFPSKIMPKLYGIEDKSKYTIIHGTYNIEPIREKHPKENNYIHVIYAGTLDIRKGSLEAVNAAKYLPSNYHIHICGDGSKRDLECLKRLIEKVNKKNNAQVIYEGVLRGEEYIKFLQMCDIGLCTQDPLASFTASSFPSKILSYLSNGLRVLAIDIPAIRESDVSEILYFYSVQNEKEIANSLLKIDLRTEYNSREFVKKLYMNSKEELGKMIKTLYLEK